jgi:hypothetical protein
MSDRARAVTFTEGELDVLGVSRDVLAPFILRDADKQALTDEITGHSSLERRPLIDIGAALVLALPHAVSPAIRSFVLFELRQMGYLQAFADALAHRQARQVEREGLWELKRETESLKPLLPDSKVPSLHS